MDYVDLDDKSTLSYFPINQMNSIKTTIDVLRDINELVDRYTDELLTWATQKTGRIDVAEDLG